MENINTSQIDESSLIPGDSEDGGHQKLYDSVTQETNTKRQIKAMLKKHMIVKKQQKTSMISEIVLQVLFIGVFGKFLLYGPLKSKYGQDVKDWTIDALQVLSQ